MRFSRFTRAKNRVLRQIDRVVTTRNAIGMSIGLHLLLGMALAALWTGNQLATHSEGADEIVFELQTIKEKQPFEGVQGQSSEEYGVPNQDAAKASGKASNPVRGNMNKSAVVMASLTALTDLRDSFSFVTHAVAADSLGGFSPIDGEVPGSEYDSFGRKKGQGIGAGGVRIYVSGGGVCTAPRP